MIEWLDWYTLCLHHKCLFLFIFTTIIWSLHVWRYWNMLIFIFFKKCCFFNLNEDDNFCLYSIYSSNLINTRYIFVTLPRKLQLSKLFQAWFYRLNPFRLVKMMKNWRFDMILLFLKWFSVRKVWLQIGPSTFPWSKKLDTTF